MNEVFIALLAAAVAALGSYLAASRRLSGKIGTSEAGDLWAESSAIRDYLGGRITNLEARVAQLETANSDLRNENWELRRQNDSLRERVETLEQENDSLKKTIRKVMAANGE